MGIPDSNEATTALPPSQTSCFKEDDQRATTLPPEMVMAVDSSPEVRSLA